MVLPHYVKIQDFIQNPRPNGSQNDLRIDTLALRDRFFRILIQKLEIGDWNLENGERKSENWTSEDQNLGGAWMPGAGAHLPCGPGTTLAREGPGPNILIDIYIFSQ